MSRVASCLGEPLRDPRTSAVQAAIAELANVCANGKLLDELPTIFFLSSVLPRAPQPGDRIHSVEIRSELQRQGRAAIMSRRGANRAERRGRRGGQSSGEAEIQIDVNDEEHNAARGSFVDITQAPPDVATHYLEAYGWNIEAAVSAFLENGGQSEIRKQELVEDSGMRTQSRHADAHEIDIVADDINDSDFNEEDAREEGDESDDSHDQLQTLALHRQRRSNGSNRSRRSRRLNGDGGNGKSDEEDEDEDEDYMDEDLYGEEEERFKYGRRTRRGHRRSIRRMERQQTREDQEEAAHHIPEAVLNLPDVNLEEQKMLMAAMTGQAYAGEIPDFSNYVPYAPKPLSPGAIERQMLRDEQDVAFQESLEMDRERQRKEEMAQIEQMEREESERREQQALLNELEIKKQRLPAEPASDDPSGLSLAIRLPNGTRLKRRFSKTDALSSVFDYVEIECHPELRNGGYRLATNFPRKVLSPSEASTSLEKLGFSTQEALFVEATSS